MVFVKSLFLTHIMYCCTNSLQHWTDYCPAGKEPACPVCKQCYAQHPPTRLYFQSTANSDNTDTEPATNSNCITANLPEGAVIRMELRISALDARVREVDHKVSIIHLYSVYLKNYSIIVFSFSVSVNIYIFSFVHWNCHLSLFGKPSLRMPVLSSGNHTMLSQ